MLVTFSSFFIFLIGLVVGSFLNVCIYRLPRRQSIIAPPSRCTSCGRPLSPVDLIPVLGYLFLRGKCGGCGSRISVQYPLVELLTAAIFMVLFVRFRIGLEFASYAVLSCFLIVAAFIDLNTMEIPDSVTIPGTMAGLMFSGFLGTAPKALLGAALGLGLLSVISFIGKRAYKREVMGDGDAMLLMMIGAGLGFAGAITSIFLSFFIGGAMAVVLLVLRVRKFGEEIPFGPMIALGAGLYIFYGDAVIMWYLRLLGFL